ncbi:hypothetical protein Agub_g13407, partial [Astrephomene gubernaculifera]
GLLETLHALRNLLLRGLWAIAGLEGLFVGLLAAGGVTELTLMVAAVALGPQELTRSRRRGSGPTGANADGSPTPPLSPTSPPPPAVSLELTEEAVRRSRGADGVGGGGGGQARQPASADAAPDAATVGGANTSSSANGGGGDVIDIVVPRLASSSSVRSHLSFSHLAAQLPYDIHFPSAAAVAATAAEATVAATAAATAAASAAAAAAARVPWRTLALLAAVGYMEVAASLHLLCFALGLWIGVLGASEGCSAAVQGLYRVISFSPDVCLDLSMIGVPGPRCGGDLLRMCNVWRQLRLSGLLYGSLLIIAARLLLLVMATANYHSRHAVLLPLPQPSSSSPLLHPPPSTASLRRRQQQHCRRQRGGNAHKKKSEQRAGVCGAAEMGRRSGGDSSGGGGMAEGQPQEARRRRRGARQAAAAGGLADSPIPEAGDGSDVDVGGIGTAKTTAVAVPGVGGAAGTTAAAAGLRPRQVTRMGSGTGSVLPPSAGMG